MSIYQYPLDLSGKLTSNRVTLPITVGSGKVDRAFIFPAGAFYTKDARIYETGKPTTPLTREKDFEFIIGHPLYRRLSGNKEVVLGVIIKNPQIGSALEMTANVVGGPESAMVEGYEEVIRNLKLDDLSILFKDIDELPDYFTAAPAYKDLGDIYGFEYIISVLNALLNAKGASDQLALETLEAVMEDIKTIFLAALKAHVEATGNVHGLDIHDINGYTQTEIDTLLTAIRKSIDALRATLNDIVARLDGVDNRMNGFEAALNKHGAALGTLREDYDRLYVLIANLQREMEEVIAKEIGKIKDQLVVMQDEINSLKGKNDQLQNTVNNLALEIENLKIRMGNCETNIAQADQNLQNHIKADDPHTNYLHKIKGGVVQNKVHINAEFTTRDDMVAFDGTK